MKKRILFVVGICLAVFAFVACSDGSNATTSQTGNGAGEQNDGTNPGGNPEVTANIDDQVRACFNATNAFRTGSEAYYVNEDNTTKTNLVGTLSALTLDEDLCKAAQIRANEIVKNFSHTRPNGSSCFTVFDDFGISASAKGENIAAGSSTGAATFTQSGKRTASPTAGKDTAAICSVRTSPKWALRMPMTRTASTNIIGR